jgi:hypothetical protein
MESIETNQQPENNLFFLNKDIAAYLTETAKWGKFLAIVGYVGMGLLVIVAFFMMFGLSAISKIPGGFYPVAMGLIYVVLAGIYYIPITYLYRFSVRIKEGIANEDENKATNAFQDLKSLFKFMGIFTLVILSVYALVLIIAIPTMFLFKDTLNNL